ncbi:MAG: nucleotidyltransferase domain-containing protein [Candidatus Korarchaeota archaeon]|nr:nucleotidyltransferase domain-containing protein [Candidatus Korarchaeota archaeon]
MFRLDYDGVVRSLSSYARRKVREGALAVILIGSLARGNYTAFSDADVVVVVPDGSAPGDPAERVGEFLDPSLPIDLDPFVYEKSELVEMARQGRRIVDEILRVGRILAGDPGILEELERNWRSRES